MNEIVLYFICNFFYIIKFLNQNSLVGVGQENNVYALLLPLADDAELGVCDDFMELSGDVTELGGLVIRDELPLDSEFKFRIPGNSSNFFSLKIFKRCNRIVQSVIASSSRS